jgi:hypothetical protein
MLDRILPRRLDNDCRGRRLALLALMTLGLALSLWKRADAPAHK